MVVAGIFLIGIGSLVTGAVWNAHRMERFCTSVQVGEPIRAVMKRADEQGFNDPDNVVRFFAEPLDGKPGEYLVGAEGFAGSHLLCAVRHDGAKVLSVKRADLQ